MLLLVFVIVTAYHLEDIVDYFRAGSLTARKLPKQTDIS